MSIPVIAVASRIPDPVRESYYRYPEFLRSVRRFGVEPTILGMNGGYHGLLSRAKLLRDHLRKGIGSEWMIWSDAYDVLFVDSPEVIVQRVKDLGHDIVINCERNCWPDPELAKHFPQNERYPYLNTGWFAGKTEAILALMEASNCENDVDYQENGKWVHFSEQLNIQKAYINGGHDVALDTTGSFCNTLVGAPDDEISIEQNRPYNKATFLYPSVVHCNGGKANPNWDRALEWFKTVS